MSQLAIVSQPATLASQFLFFNKLFCERDTKAKEMFLPDCIDIWWWEHFIYGFSDMGHPDNLWGSLLRGKLADLRGPSADIQAPPGIPRQRCHLQGNVTGL